MVKGWGEDRESRPKDKGGQSQAYVTETSTFLLPQLPIQLMSHPGPPRPAVSQCCPLVDPLSQSGGITGGWVSRCQSALPLCSRKHLLPQLCDRFFSTVCVEIIPLVLPNIIYSCLIFPSTSKLPNESRWGAIFPVWVSEHPLFSTPAFEDSTLAAKSTHLQENT